MAFLSPSGSCRILAIARMLRASLALGIGWLALAGTSGRAQPPASPEYQVKAVFLFNFVQFVEWPPRAFRDDHAPLVIGVLGEDRDARNLAHVFPVVSYIPHVGQINVANGACCSGRVAALSGRRR